MKLKEIMTKDPIVLKPEHTVCQAAAIFLKNRIDGAVVVNDSGVLIGIFSKQHIYKSISKGIGADAPVKHVMRSSKIVYRHPDDDVYDIINYIRVGRLPVVDQDLKVVGIVTRDNIAKFLSKTSKDLSEDLQYLLEHSVDGFSIMDGNGTIIYRNKVMEKLTGIPNEEAIGLTVRQLQDKGYYIMSATSFCLHEKAPLAISQTNHLGKKIMTTCNPVLDQDGNIKRIICHFKDLTDLAALQEELQNATRLSRKYKSELNTLRQHYHKRKKVVYASSQMQELMEYVARLAAVDSTVLITGESGTGKELIAETIHHLSERKDGPLIKVNCGSIPENLFESELFGYEPGAFTGARREGKPGFLDLAENGVIFLDEIGEMPYNLQVKLLRILQDKEFIRVGGNSYQKANVRIIAATNRDLYQMVQDKLFREDLYYRLNVIPVHVLPLRERTADIPVLINHFTKLYCIKYNLKKEFDTESISQFCQYNWPGNIRELENLVENLIVTCPEDIITPAYLPRRISSDVSFKIPNPSQLDDIPLKQILERVEKQVIEYAYTKYKSTRRVASALNVDASTIIRKLNKYGINPKVFK
ncbi:MAG: sigma 54-interacting transcriptional regulator [Syntrophomonadaceae bacterium]|nr:sigma 54-interacting transcriptional regulator [Syntrophomonadaceae bacterium]